MKKLLVSLVAVITIITVKHVSANNGYDEIENAKEVTLDGSNELKLKSQKKDYDDQNDFYKLKVTEPGKVKIRIDSLPLSIERYSDVNISIVNKEREVFSSFTLLDYDSKRDYIYSYLKKGTYYLQVSLDNIELDETYSISASLDLNGYYEAELNNIPSMANNLEVNQQYEGSFLEHDLISELDELGEEYIDVDYYRFKVEKDSKIQLLTTTGSKEQLQYSLLDRSGNKILADIKTRALKTSKTLNQGTIYLKKGEYIVGLHHEDYDLNHEVPYKLKINSTPVIYSEVNGSNFLFGKTYNGSLLETNDESDVDVFAKKSTETLYVKTYAKFKSGDITELKDGNEKKIEVTFNKKKATVQSLKKSNQWYSLIQGQKIEGGSLYKIQIKKEFDYFNPLVDYEIKTVAYPYWGKLVYSPKIIGKVTTQETKTQLYSKKNGKYVKSRILNGKNVEYKIIQKGTTYAMLENGSYVKVKDIRYTSVPKSIKNKYKDLNNLK